jgi:hypothetical protein
MCIVDTDTLAIYCLTVIGIAQSTYSHSTAGAPPFRYPISKSTLTVYFRLTRLSRYSLATILTNMRKMVRLSEMYPPSVDLSDSTHRNPSSSDTTSDGSNSSQARHSEIDAQAARVPSRHFWTHLPVPSVQTNQTLSDAH